MTASKLQQRGLDVFGFDAPHRIGSICTGENCEQCGSPTLLTGTYGEKLPDVPLLIVAEATVEDWKQAIRNDGGGVEPFDEPGPYNYFVMTD